MNQKTELFPLSGAQGLIYYQLKFAINKAAANINASLHLDGDINVSLMQQAMFFALCRNKSVSV